MNASLNRENTVKWLLAISLMLVVQFFSMQRNLEYMRTNGFGRNHNMNIDSPLQQWIDDVKGSDNSSYLMVAQNIAEGHGVSYWCEDCNPQQYRPWLAWAPGTPLALAACIKIARAFGFPEMRFIFYVWNFLEIFVGIVILAILWKFTQSLPAMMATAIFCGWCPPVQGWYYDWSMINSEFGTQIPISLFFFCLASGYLAYWRKEPGRKICLWFAVTGFFLSMAGMARASLLTVGPFIAMASLAIFWLRRKKYPIFRVGVAAVLCFYAGLQVFPTVAKVWNKKRVGRYVTFDGTSWLTVFWQPYGVNGFVVDSGLGAGDYLDPAKGERLRQQNPGNTKLFVEYAKTVLSHPFQWIAFKVQRLPMLFLNTAPFPRAELTRTGWYSLLFYIGLGLLVFLLRAQGMMIPEVLYLYLLFMCCAACLIHFEYRYTNALWIPLRVVPGLLVATMFQIFKPSETVLKLIRKQQFNYV